MTLYLVGMMGAGKSTVGRPLAERLQRTFVDLDDRIEEREGQRISEIFKTSGENGFREAEHAALETVAGEALVIATGGGIVIREENRGLMKATGQVVYLRARAETLKGRLASESAHRPLLAAGLDRIDRLLDERAALYEACADLVIDVDDAKIQAVVDAVLASLGEGLMV